MGRTPSGETRDKIWRFMRERLLAGRPPTVREVQAAFGFQAVQSAREHLEALVAEGRLAKEAGRARGYHLPFSGDEAPVLVPILGRVQAGALDYAVEDLEGYVPVQARSSPTASGRAARDRKRHQVGGREQSHGGDECFEPADLFGLRVRGQSMRDAGIFPDDIVVVRRQSTARSGEIVVALVGEEATVKRLRLRGRRIELHPENPDFEPLVPEPEEVTVLGKVIEVRRFL